MRVTPAHRVLGHRRAVRCEPVAVKRRLHESALAPVRLALRAQEPVANDPPPGFEREASEPGVMRDEHVLHVVGMIEQEEVPRSDAKVDDVAVLPGGGLEVAEGVAPECQNGRAGEPVAWAWGILPHRSPQSVAIGGATSAYHVVRDALRLMWMGVSHADAVASQPYAVRQSRASTSPQVV